MKKILSKYGVATFVIAICLMLTAAVFSQDEQPKPRVSPAASVSQTLGEATEIVITYSRPGVKGRTIWGELVPYDKIWRAGANEATTFSSNHDVLIEGQKLAAGKYALFTVPGADSWQIIFNSVADQWGAYNRDAAKDVLIVTVTPMGVPGGEWLSFSFEQLNGTSAVAALHWAGLKVPFKVATTQTEGKIRASLKGGFTQTIGLDTQISVTYSRPGVKGRTIWGELVPYGKVWRTGANENTVFTVSSDVLVNGQKLAAGTYGLQTIPGENEWTVIFSNKSDDWGSGEYTPGNDALRVTVKPQTTDAATEWMQIAATDLTGSDNGTTAATVAIQWANLTVPFTVSLP